MSGTHVASILVVANETLIGGELVAAVERRRSVLGAGGATD